MPNVLKPKGAPPTSPVSAGVYTKDQFDYYRKKLAYSLMEDGLSCEAISSNNDYKAYINNYVETEIIGKNDENAKNGIVKKLANMAIDSVLRDKGIVYPVINEYKGHDLIAGYYFAKNHDGEISVKKVDVVKTSLII